MARRELLPQPVEFGKYQLIERIAVGRMGEVYKAKRGGVEGFEKVLVVKKIFANLSASEHFVNTFVDEAKLTVSLSHANIVQVMDLGQQQGCYFMAMEHVAGYDLGTVRRMLNSVSRPFPQDIAVFAISEVAKGLDYAHRRKDYNFESLNIVHRDLSPANILISFEGEVKITDFGISRALEVVGGASDNIRRQFLYASPEQARNEPLTHRSDIFSLGLILYELISGVHPYDDPDPRVVQRRAAEGSVRPIRQVMDLPRALEQIINSSLVSDPNQRVDSAGTLYEELISYLFASGHKADNRSLSLFMQEVRQHEEEFFKQASSMAVSGAAQALDVEDMIELDPEELEVVESSSDLFEMAGNQPSSSRAQLPANNLKVNHSSFAGAEGMRTSASIPSAMLEARQQASRFDPVPQPDAMPQRLSQLANGVRAGRGSAVALTGSLGQGRDHLPDRLGARLRARGLFQVMELSLVADDRCVPYTLATALVRFGAGLPAGGRVHQAAYSEDFHSEAAAIHRLSNIGLAVHEVEMAMNLCGIMDTYQKGFHSKRDWTLGLVWRLLQTMMAQNPVVLLISGVEHLDPLSTELLMHLASQAPANKLFIVASANNPEGQQTLSGATADNGAPLFESVNAEANPGSLSPASLFDDLPAQGRTLLLLLALFDQPLPVSKLVSLTQSTEDTLGPIFEDLARRGVLRLVPPEHLELAPGPVRERLLQGLADGQFTQSAALARQLYDASYGGFDTWLSARLVCRLRLLLHMGAVWPAIDGALAYAGRLALDGWSEAAIEHLQRFESFMDTLGMGLQSGRAAMRIEQARHALDMMQLGRVRAIMDTVWPLVEQTMDERLLVAGRCVEAQLAQCNGKATDALGLWHAALGGALRINDVALSFKARTGLAQWMLHDGNIILAQEHLDAALSLVQAHPEGSVCTHGDLAEALALLIMVLCRRNHLGRANELLEHLQQHALRVRQARVDGLLAYARSEWLRLTGHGQDAVKEAEDAYNAAREHNFISLNLALALQVAMTALSAHDANLTQSYSQHLIELGQGYGHQPIAHIGRDMASLSLVLTSTGDKALDALQELHNILKRAQEREDDLRAHFHAHHLLFVALNHLGSGRDAEHHRQEALRCATGAGVSNTAI